MKIKEFLQDYIDFIIFYFFTAVMISLIVYLDNDVKVSLENLIYLDVLIFVLFLCFLVLQFIKKKKHLGYISELLDKDKIEAIDEHLDKPLSNEQKIYFNLLHKISSEHIARVSKLYDEKKEFSDFINFWVHEIKTPIAACRLFLERQDISKEKTIDIVEEKIMSIENYVEQALYYARLDNFSSDYFIGEINAEKLIKNIVKKNARLFIGKRIGIELDKLDFTVNSDSKWLNFITEQIVLNAIKYTDNNGKIKIYGIQSEKENCIVIEDNGIGIKEEDIKRVFDKGFTGYNGRKDMKATGIGLYLSKRLANKLGHDISIESVYSEYTKVFIHFPAMIDYYIAESNITKL